MEKFLMICYVAADFVSPDGDRFSVTPSKIGVFVEAPVWVKDTLLFKWLLRDGTVKVAEYNISVKQGENDPMKDIAADGKAIEEPAEEPVEEPAEEPEEVIPVKKTRSKKAKKVDAE